MAKIMLDLGCGKKKRAGCIGVDYSDRHHADLIHDLNQFPYPFEENSVDYVYLDNVLEHLDEPIKVMEEIYRILVVGGGVKVITPYFRSIWAFIDPTHKSFYTVDSFSYYDPSNIVCQRYDYTHARFSVDKIIFNENLRNRWNKKFILRLANKFPRIYEVYMSHLYPLDDITYYLTKL
jgi:SAM-dependent methyltransferase